MGYRIDLGNTIAPLKFRLIASSDHVSPKTGATPSVTIGKNGGTPAAPAGAVSELGSGWYQVAANAFDASVVGPLILHATATAADPCDDLFDVGPDGQRTVPLNNASEVVPFLLISSSDHITGKTGVTPTVTIAKNGAGFTAPAVSPLEWAYGWYYLPPNATDANVLGPLILHATAAGADPADEIYTVVSPASQVTSQATVAYSITASEIITRAAKALGVLGGVETLPADQATDGFRLLNEIVDAWNAQRWTAISSLGGSFPLTNGVQDYSIGEFNAAMSRPRPVLIERASITVAGIASEIPVAVLDDKEWDLLTVKTLTSPYVQAIHYNPTIPNGLIEVWPIPTQGQTLNLYLPDLFAGFASLTSVYRLPPMYTQALRTNLAVAWAPEFGVQPSPVLLNLSVTSLDVLKRNNVDIPAMEADEAYQTGAGYGVGDWTAIYRG